MGNFATECYCVVDHTAQSSRSMSPVLDIPTTKNPLLHDSIPTPHRHSSSTCGPHLNAAEHTTPKSQSTPDKNNQKNASAPRRRLIALYGVDDAHVPLLEAAIYGDVFLLQQLLAARADANATSAFGRSALHFATTRGHIAAVRVLLNANADVNACSDDKYTPLLAAVHHENEDILHVLLAAKADPNIGGILAELPLLCATRNNYIGIVEALLAARADVEACDKDGNTALVLAARHGHAQVVQALLTARAAVHTSNMTGASPLWLAAAYGHLGIAQALLAANADVAQCDREGDTALAAAAKTGRVDMLRVLLDAQPTALMIMNARQQSPLSLAAASRDASALQVLLQAAIELAQRGTIPEDDDNKAGETKDPDTRDSDAR